MPKPVTRFVRIIMPAVAILALSACGDLLGEPEPEPHVIGHISVDGFIALALGDDPRVERTIDYNDTVVGIRADGSEHVIRDNFTFVSYFLEAGRTFLNSSRPDHYGCSTVEVVSGQPADCFDPDFGSFHHLEVLPDGSLVYAGTEIPDPPVYGQEHEHQFRRLNPDGSIDVLFRGHSWRSFTTLQNGEMLFATREEDESWLLQVSSASGSSEVFAPDFWPVVLGNWDGNRVYLGEESPAGTIWVFDLERQELDPVPYLGRGSQYAEVLHDLDDLPVHQLNYYSVERNTGDAIVLLEAHRSDASGLRPQLLQVHPELVLYEPDLEEVTAWTTNAAQLYVAGANAAGNLQVQSADLDTGVFSTVLETEGAVTAIAVTTDDQLLVAHTNPEGAGGLLTILDLVSGASNTTATESPLMNLQAY